MNITKGDTVIVLSGASKGATGRVLQVLPKKGMLLVEKVRMIKRHTKAGRSGLTQSEIVEKEAYIPVCKVNLVGRDGKAQRVRKQIAADGAKVRVGSRTKETYERKTKE